MSVNTLRMLALCLPPCIACSSLAQDGPSAPPTQTEPARSELPSQPDTQPDTQTDETGDVPEPKLAFGYLSDPAEKPKDAIDAFTSGKVHLDNRLRFEFAETTGKKPSYALTNRLRLGYETKAFYGFSALAEFENVATPSGNLYFVPATGQGNPDRTTVADPRGTEVNRVYARFKTDAIGDSSVSLDVKGGRQRIILDDSRFIGNVGWRQLEQTFDAVRVQSNLGVDGLNAQYAYVWHVQRIFGPDGPNWDSSSHLVNISYETAPELTITPFVYLLDFEEDSPINSLNNYGVRLTGRLWRGAGGDGEVYADYELTYARQEDAASNPIDVEADFVAVQARATQEGLGSAAIGYQLLGSDNGNFGFRFPLGTNHKFQGFADNFLVTPAAGLQDLYIAASLELPHGIKSAAIFHQFWSDEGGTDFGYEIDLVASKQITPNWSVLVKAAMLDGHGGQPDTARAWVQTAFRF